MSVWSKSGYWLKKIEAFSELYDPGDLENKVNECHQNIIIYEGLLHDVSEPVW